MTRHRLEPRPGYADYDITVGWDRPMRTFFAAVEHRPSGAIPVDIGHEVERVLDPGAVLDAVRDYAPIPPGLDNDLIRDALDSFGSAAEPCER